MATFTLTCVLLALNCSSLQYPYWEVSTVVAGSQVQLNGGLGNPSQSVDFWYTGYGQLALIGSCVTDDDEGTGCASGSFSFTVPSQFNSSLSFCVYPRGAQSNDYPSEVDQDSCSYFLVVAPVPYQPAISLMTNVVDVGSQLLLTASDESPSAPLLGCLAAFTFADSDYGSYIDRIPSTLPEANLVTPSYAYYVQSNISTGSSFVIEAPHFAALQLSPAHHYDVSYVCYNAFGVSAAATLNGYILLNGNLRPGDTYVTDQPVTSMLWSDWMNGFVWRWTNPFTTQAAGTVAASLPLTNCSLKLDLADSNTGLCNMTWTSDSDGLSCGPYSAFLPIEYGIAGGETEGNLQMTPLPLFDLQLTVTCNNQFGSGNVNTGLYTFQRLVGSMTATVVCQQQHDCLLVGGAWTTPQNEDTYSDSYAADHPHFLSLRAGAPINLVVAGNPTLFSSIVYVYAVPSNLADGHHWTTIIGSCVLSAQPVNFQVGCTAYGVQVSLAALGVVSGTSITICAVSNVTAEYACGLEYAIIPSFPSQPSMILSAAASPTGMNFTASQYASEYGSNLTSCSLSYWPAYSTWVSELGLSINAGATGVVYAPMNQSETFYVAFSSLTAAVAGLPYDINFWCTNAYGESLPLYISAIVVGASRVPYAPLASTFSVTYNADDEDVQLTASFAMPLSQSIRGEVDTGELDEMACSAQVSYIDTLSGLPGSNSPFFMFGNGYQDGYALFTSFGDSGNYYIDWPSNSNLTITGWCSNTVGSSAASSLFIANPTLYWQQQQPLPYVGLSVSLLCHSSLDCQSAAEDGSQWTYVGGPTVPGSYYQVQGCTSVAVANLNVSISHAGASPITCLTNAIGCCNLTVNSPTAAVGSSLSYSLFINVTHYWQDELTIVVLPPTPTQPSISMGLVNEGDDSYNGQFENWVVVVNAPQHSGKLPLSDCHVILTPLGLGVSSATTAYVNASVGSFQFVLSHPAVGVSYYIPGNDFPVMAGLPYQLDLYCVNAVGVSPVYTLQGVVLPRVPFAPTGLTLQQNVANNQTLVYFTTAAYNGNAGDLGSSDLNFLPYCVVQMTLASGRTLFAINDQDYYDQTDKVDEYEKLSTADYAAFDGIQPLSQFPIFVQVWCINDQGTGDVAVSNFTQYQGSTESPSNIGSASFQILYNVTDSSLVPSNLIVLVAQGIAQILAVQYGSQESVLVPYINVTMPSSGTLQVVVLGSISTAIGGNNPAVFNATTAIDAIIALLATGSFASNSIPGVSIPVQSPQTNLNSTANTQYEPIVNAYSSSSSTASSSSSSSSSSAVFSFNASGSSDISATFQLVLTVIDTSLVPSNLTAIIALDIAQSLAAQYGGSVSNLLPFLNVSLLSSSSRRLLTSYLTLQVTVLGNISTAIGGDPTVFNATTAANSIVSQLSAGSFTVNNAPGVTVPQQNPQVTTTTAGSSTSSMSSSSSSGLSKGAIAGIVVGSVVGAVLLAVIAYFLVSSRSKPSRASVSQAADVSKPIAGQQLPRAVQAQRTSVQMASGSNGQTSELAPINREEGAGSV